MLRESALVQEKLMSYLEKYFNKVAPSARTSAATAYLAALDHIKHTSPLVTEAIVQELKDQRSHLKLIASENYSSLAVQLSMGNLLTDKYAEGYPQHRFYAGCDNVDRIEQAAVNEAKILFGAEHAYVQPHSGADANLVAFWSILVQRVQNKELEKLGKKSIDTLSSEEYESVRMAMLSQKMMGLSLHSGGHLTHGYRHNVSAKMMRSVSYDVDPTTERLDYSHLSAKVKEEKPAILIAGYSAYPRPINFATMREIADSVGATLMVDMAHFAGLVAGKVFTGDYNPVPFAHIVTSTTHKTLRGPRGGLILCDAAFKEIVDKGCPLVLGGPLPHVIAAKEIAFKEARSHSFQEYAQQIVRNSQALGRALMTKGARLTTSGTENHLMVIDTMASFGLTGRQAESVLRKAGVTANRNAIPFDTQKPWYTSGIRLGTPAVTTLGMRESDMEEIASYVIDILRAATPVSASPSEALIDTDIAEKIQKNILLLLERFPLYPEILL